MVIQDIPAKGTLQVGRVDGRPGRVGRTLVASGFTTLSCLPTRSLLPTPRTKGITARVGVRRAHRRPNRIPRTHVRWTANEERMGRKEKKTPQEVWRKAERDRQRRWAGRR